MWTWAGLGRAPLTVLGYLTLAEGQDLELAIQSILKGRPGAVPAWEAYRGCGGDLDATHRQAIGHRGYKLYQRGENRDVNADGRQARAEVPRSCLVGALGSSPRLPTGLKRTGRRARRATR